MRGRPNRSPRIGDVERQGRRTRAAVTLLVAMLYIVAGCTALAPERQPEATHSAKAARSSPKRTGSLKAEAEFGNS